MDTRALNEAQSDVIERVRRSLVVLRDGRRGIGAGVIWRQDGLILTNNHVAGRKRLLVRLSDGVEYRARLVAKDTRVDLALLQIDAHGLPAALIADSRSARVGQFVLALGHPWGQQDYVTAGIISGLSTAHTRKRTQPVDILRTDVRLAPGNSGGPLVNAAGGVLGINTMVVGGDLGVAIPSHVVEAFVDREMKRVRTPFRTKSQKDYSYPGVEYRM